MRLIMDVDTGVDDALALALAVRHPGIQLEAVLTVAGNVGLDLTTRNTLRVLDWLGASDVVVAAGAARPLSGAVWEASHWHGLDGLGGARLPESARQPLDDAVGYLIRRVLAEPGKLTLVCTGPCTNLAVAVQRQPALVTALRQVVVMGGAVRPPGNATPVAEFNILADPEAAAIVFSQPWPITLVGLDVTMQVPLTRAERDATAGVDSPAAVLVREVTRHLFDGRGLDRLALHDPLAVAVALDPTLVTTLRRTVQIETRGDFTRGQTVVDLRPQAPDSDLPSLVCIGVDAARFKAQFFDTLGFSPELR